ncbi:low temperature requirement protein A [Terrabacter sp. MAHUQ-38]|uniref:low temperature requirement protein A n=1 Tax=unclassified Terrabacter TaxID=2630222 RepID=UPI001CAA7242
MSHTNLVPLRRRMQPRDPHEAHRVATPLELLFDLVFVVAIASAAAGWHHGIVEGHVGDLAGFVMVFFAIWWAWMNFTWFASAYDCDDVAYRLLAFAIMAGSLLIAAGTPGLFDTGQSTLVVAGYAVMRFAMVAMWLRAAGGHPEGRQTALWYAGGIAVVQALWIGRLLVEGLPALLVSFWALVVLELLVPVLAERHGITPFHPHHIAERYSLLTIIVLGEVILASVQAVQGALVEGRRPGLLLVVAGGLLTVFAMWWLYFKREHADLFEGPVRTTFAVGYGHYVVFASVAATGAALAAAVDVVQGDGHVAPRVVGLALASSVAVYVWALGAMHAALDRDRREGLAGGAVGVLALVVGAAGASMGVTVLLIGLVLAGAVAQHVLSTRDEPDAVTTA